MPKIAVLHGVNLNMFGLRDPRYYGSETLEQINTRLAQLASELGVELSCFQSNSEGVFVEHIHALHTNSTSAVVVNAGAWTHYSYAIADALAILTIPIIEVHMSNIHAREAFRHHSVLSAVCHGSIVGFGADSYLLGLRAAANVVIQPSLKNTVQGIPK